MRTLLITLCGLLVLLSSCEKPVLTEEETPSEAQGNLTVSIHEIWQTPFSEFTRTAPSEACTRLNFAVYNTAGSRVKQTNQTITDTDFGTVSFQLPEGDYQLVVVAHSSDGNPTMTNPSKIQFTNALGYTDTFLYSEQVTVGSKPQSLSVSLSRIVALCRFIINDTYPQGVSKMQFIYTGGSGAFDIYTGLGSVKSTQTVTYNVAAGERQFDLYTFLHDVEGTIQLQAMALDAAGNVITERAFSVPLKQNQITWLSGAFFDGESQEDNIITIDIDTAWEEGQQLIY